MPSLTRTHQVTLGVVGITYAILKARKVNLNRDGSDYKVRHAAACVCGLKQRASLDRFDPLIC